jgi:hypothetical protein
MEINTAPGTYFRKAILDIRQRMLAGEFDIVEAERLAQPYIDEMNKRGASIANKYGKTFKKLTFRYIAR